VEEDAQQMTRHPLTINPELTILMAGIGLAFGSVYFSALRRAVTQFVGGKGWIGPLALTLGRIGAAVGLLLVATKLGAAPLLGTFIGFLMARALALRAGRKGA
jgi:hypothetical protein